MRWGRMRNLWGASSLFFALALISTVAAPAALANTEEDSIAASNAVVIDADSGEVLFDKDMDEQVAPASLTKIFTAIVALESAKPDTELTVNEYDLVGEASVGLQAGETQTLDTLLHGLMLTSGNDAAMTIARELGNLPGDSPQESVSRFMERVNATVSRLGLSNTTLRNPHGLDQSDHLTSAADIAAMSKYALKNPTFEKLISTPYHAGSGREFYNVNALMDQYPGLIGGKTGITDDAGYCLMQVAERNGKTVLVVLLGSTEESWYADAQYLLDLGFESLEDSPDDESRPVIGLLEETALEVPEVEGGEAVGGNLVVDRLSDHEAVVRSSSVASESDGPSWRWPLVAIGSMGAALVLVLNYQVLIGLSAVAVERGSRMRLNGPPNLPLPSASALLSTAFGPIASRMGRATRKQFARQTTTSRERRERPRFSSREQWTPRQGGRSMTSDRSTATVSAGRARAEKAIQLAMQSRYHAATEEFKAALEREPDLDLTKCPGFWRMQAMGYISAAKAYKLNRQRDEGRRLLTVVQLAFSSNKDLSRLFDRAMQAIDD